MCVLNHITLDICSLRAAVSDCLMRSPVATLIAVRRKHLQRRTRATRDTCHVTRGKQWHAHSFNRTILVFQSELWIYPDIYTQKHYGVAGGGDKAWCNTPWYWSWKRTFEKFEVPQSLGPSHGWKHLQESIQESFKNPLRHYALAHGKWVCNRDTNAKKLC